MSINDAEHIYIVSENVKNSDATKDNIKIQAKVIKSFLLYVREKQPILHSLVLNLRVSQVEAPKSIKS